MGQRLRELIARLRDALPHRVEVDAGSRQTVCVELRLPSSLLSDVRRHVEDLRLGEEVGFLVCTVVRRPGVVCLLGREWHPLPRSAITRGSAGYVSAWGAEINSRMLQQAISLGVTVVHVHSHGSVASPRLSTPDRQNAAELLEPMSRILSPHPVGSVVLGSRAASGRFWIEGREASDLERLIAVGSPIDVWYPGPAPALPTRRRLARQTAALGRDSEPLLRAASVAVIGVCGGGSHVCQQLAHQGVGRIVPIDDELVEDVNLGRMIGAGPDDVGTTRKTSVMRRLIHHVDPTISVQEVPERFPAPATLAALKSADVVVACVDRFDVREQINAFCRRHHLPLVDIGINIETENGVLISAFGQMITVLPDSPCLRCTPFLSDAVLAREQRERPRGYDRNLDTAGDPQVVSMNGVLASEAASSVLDLLTGFANGARGAAWWLYDGRSGRLDRAELPPHRLGCPACAEQGLGDPAT